MMVKQKLNKNGYTLVEMLIVLSIVLIFSTLLLTNHHFSNLKIQMLQMKEIILQQQIAARDQRNHTQIEIKHDKLIYDNKQFIFSDIVCEENTIRFNGSGNIAKAATICCHEKNQQLCLVLQLGSGRCSLEKGRFYVK